MKAKGLVVLTFVLMLNCNMYSLANTDTNNEIDSINNLEYMISPEDAKDKSYWEQLPGGWKYYDCNGDIVTGYFYDKNGDFYYAEEDGYILLNKLDIWGQEYGADGRLVNTGYSGYINGAFDTKCIDLENGVNVEFSNLTELYDFIEYYGKEYNMGSQNLIFRAYKKKKLNAENEIESVTYFTNNSRNELYNRENTIKLFEENFNQGLIGETLEDKLKSACEYAKVMEYSDEYLGASMEVAITDKKGGCWHLAKIVHYLLDRENIISEVVTGKSYGVPHMWLRVKNTDGSWIYCDPTYYVNGLEEYLNIDYKIYTDNYRTNRFFTR